MAAWTMATWIRLPGHTSRQAAIAAPSRALRPSCGAIEAWAATPWKVARLPVSDGVHRVDADLPVSVIAYGYDRDVSYGYAAGLNLVEDD